MLWLLYMKENTVSIGDRVRFTRCFLRSTAQYTGPEAPCSYGPWARGEVLKMRRIGGNMGMDLATIRWDDGEDGNVNVKNLEAHRKGGKYGGWPAVVD